jgi:L-ascorbate metabolism protein UlaG (beta-lactamase superfamily)
MNEFWKSVTDTPAPKGTAVLWWLGQMGLAIKMGETVLCVDQYASKSPKGLVLPPSPAEDVSGVTAFLGTHDHSDHMDHPSWRVWAQTCPDALFVFPRAHRQSVLADGIREENCRGLNDGESCRVGEITVRAVAAAHEFLAPDPQTGLYPCLQYIIEGNGLRIYHAGDTLRYEGMLSKLRAFGPIDAALLPINGRDGARYRRNCIGNMTFQEAADLAGELRPGLVIPGHWDMFADNPGDPDAFADYLDAKYPGQVRCALPQRFAPVILTARER